MKINLKIIVFINLIFLIYTNQLSKERNLQSYSCSEFNNCFNCSVCGEYLVTWCKCKWNSYSCVESNNNYYNSNFRSSYENCIDSESKEIQKKYCGEIIEDTKNKTIYLSLPEVDGYYGQLNLFCKYNYKSTFKKDAVFKFDFERNDESYYDFDQIQLQFTIVYNEDLNDFSKKIDSYYYSTSAENLKEFIIEIECRTMYTKSPFIVNISYTKGSSKIGLILAIIAIIIICIGCSIIVYCFSKKISENARIRHNQILEARLQRQMILNYNEINNEENERIRNKKIIENKLKDPNLLGEKICEKEHEKYGTNCTICLEELKIGVSKVSVTPCQHVFHYKCLFNWLMKKDSTFKCPVCNFNLLDSKIENEKFIIKDPENIRINRRNNQGNNNNTEREVSNQDNNILGINNNQMRINNQNRNQMNNNNNVAREISNQDNNNLRVNNNQIRNQTNNQDV
jgi:hypothetical protein